MRHTRQTKHSTTQRLLRLFAAAAGLVGAVIADAQQPGEPYRTAAASEPASANSQPSKNDGLLALPPILTPSLMPPGMTSPTSASTQGFMPWPTPPATAANSSADNSDPSRMPATLASFPRDATEPLLDQPNNFVLIPESQQPSLPPTRAGMFQRISITTTYLPRFGDDNDGFEDTEVYGVFAVPCPTRDMPLLLEPGADFWVVDSPNVRPSLNLPPTLNDDYLEFHWLAKLNDRWGADLMVTPGWHSDYQNTTASQAFRPESHAVVAYTWSDNLKIAVGAAYWGRLNANIVPAGGIIWTPNVDTRLELITPKPRIAYRVDFDSTTERWAYIAGEFGGDQWAIEQDVRGLRPLENELNYSDYRIMLGIEQKSLNLGLNGFAEFGYVFNRQLEYRYFFPDQNLPNTVMVRAGLSY
jgi:hypothetical protein